MGIANLSQTHFVHFENSQCLSTSLPSLNVAALIRKPGLPKTWPNTLSCFFWVLTINYCNDHFLKYIIKTIEHTVQKLKVSYKRMLKVELIMDIYITSIFLNGVRGKNIKLSKENRKFELSSILQVQSKIKEINYYMKRY